MQDKNDIENYFFRKLTELYLELPSGNVSRPEPPDYLIESKDATIAVEVTQIHNEKGSNERFPPAQKYATEISILKEAERLFAQSDGTPLHIGFNFASTIFLNKGERQKLSQHICEIIKSEMHGRDFTRSFSFHIQEGIPEELFHIRGYYFPNISATSWYSAKGKLIPNLSKREILRVIKLKEEKQKAYIEKVDKSILVIAEGIVPYSWFDNIEMFEQNELSTSFDKVFIIRNLDNQLIVIK